MREQAPFLAAAIELVARDLSVIPVPRPRPGVPEGEPGDGKTPSMKWKEFQTRLPTTAELTQWFRGTAMNLAIVTGAISGVVVIDADSSDALKWCTRHLVYTPWQVQTRRGFHLYYRHPGVAVKNRARLKTRDGRLLIDVRGDGGYVIAPGSVHVSGALYTQAGDWSVSAEQLPRFWPGWLQQPTPISAQRRSGPRPTGDLIERARRYLAAVPLPTIGAGSDNDTLYAACRLVRGFGLTNADAESLLWDWAGNRPGWTRDWIAAKVDHADKYGSEPIGALR